MPQDINVSFAPHIRQPLSTRRIMLDVLIGLMPAVIAAGFYFRGRGLALLAVCVVWCLATEWLCNLARKKPNSLGDLSAVVTGIILAMSLPPAFPLWAGAIGAVFAVGIGKMVFGGLGANIFNPAMVGRAFLTASFGILMTTWTVPATIDANLPQVGPDNLVDARTQATPLAWSKIAIKDENGASIYNERLPLWKSLLGEEAGSLGETSAIALLLGGLYLIVRKTIGVHIPLAVLSLGVRRRRHRLYGELRCVRSAVLSSDQRRAAAGCILHRHGPCDRPADGSRPVDLRSHHRRVHRLRANRRRVSRGIHVRRAPGQQPQTPD